MLIISRKKDQKILIAEEIEITILEVGRNRVRFGIKAPKSVAIHTKLKTSPVPAESPELVAHDDDMELTAIAASPSVIR